MATGFYMWYCRRQVAISALRLKVSVKERSIEVFFFFFFIVFTKNARKSADISKNIHFSSSLGRPMETSWRNTASRHRDNVHVNDK